MKNKKVTVINTIIFFIVAIIAIIPFYFMIIMGTHYSEDIFKGFTFLPGSYLMKNLKTVLEQAFLRFYLNSIIVSVCATVVSVLVSSLAGYALTKFNFRGRNTIFYGIIMTMMIPGHLGLIGYIMIVRIMHMNNTLLPMIIQYSANAFGVFFMAQSLEDVPDSVIESARIDGCSEPGIFFRIVMAYIRPAMSTLAILVFLWSWNNYLLPLIIVNSESLYTIPVGIKSLGTFFRTDYGAQILGLAMATLPIVILFTIGSKSFIRGLTAGAIKG